MRILQHEKRTSAGHPLRPDLLYPNARFWQGARQRACRKNQERPWPERKLKMLRYPIVLSTDTNSILVSFPDFPTANTFGDDPSEAIARATELLTDVLADYIERRQDIPAPSPIRKK